MKNAIFSVRVSKMGPKLGIYINPQRARDLKLDADSLVSIEYSKGRKRYSCLGKFCRILTLRKEEISKLNLRYKDHILVKIRKMVPIKRPKNLFYNGKIDLLSLTPEKTTRNYKIIVNKFVNGTEEWLNVWCFHSRGSCTQVRLKRFLDIASFGKLLGQLQAEGTKNCFWRLEFANKSITEHADFINYLKELGVSNDKIIVDFQYTPSVKNIKELIKKFEEDTRIKVKYVHANKPNRNSYGFHTYVRSTILSNLILSALDKIRKRLVKGNWNVDLNILADNFFAKLLNGDGNLDLQTKNRNFPQARVKITDGNLEYLRDYAKIMKIYGFNPKVLKKQIIVRAHVTPFLAEKLLLIGAFKNNPNLARLTKYLESRTILNKSNYSMVNK